MIKITYKGVDITKSVSINRCYHDMYAGNQADTLRLRANDTDHIWDSWSPQVGDEIKIDYGSVGTGTMFLTSAKPRNGTYDLVAQSAPRSAYEAQYKAWQKVRLLQLGQELAERNGLTFESYDVEDQLYSYVVQNGEGDLQFLHRRAMLEGCAVICYDKRLIMYSEPKREAEAPMETLEVTIDGDYDYNDNRSSVFGSCVVECGVYLGEFKASNGSSRILRPGNIGHVGSDAEAARFAKNLLRSANKGCCNGYVRARILTGYAAGSTVDLSNARAPSWDGAVFLEHIRNDYGRGESKIFFRRPLEGY